MAVDKKYINPKTGEKYNYYDRKGNGIEDTLEWAKLFEDQKNKKTYKRVAETTTRLGYWVSTVWLGIDYQFSPNGNPLIFETMVFKNGWSELACERYTTLREAKAGHRVMVGKWSNPFYIVWQWIDRGTWGIRWEFKEFKRKVIKLIKDNLLSVTGCLTYATVLYLLTHSIMPVLVGIFSFTVGSVFGNWFWNRRHTK